MTGADLIVGGTEWLFVWRDLFASLTDELRWVFSDKLFKRMVMNGENADISSSVLRGGIRRLS